MTRESKREKKGTPPSSEGVGTFENARTNNPTRWKWGAKRGPPGKRLKKGAKHFYDKKKKRTSKLHGPIGGPPLLEGEDFSRKVRGLKMGIRSTS